MKLKYNCTKYEKDGRVFHFVTKRNAFSPEQMEIIAADIARRDAEEAAGKRVSKFHVPHPSIFLNDIKQGAKHCVAKYGVPVEDILEEAEIAFKGSDIRKWLSVK